MPRFTIETPSGRRVTIEAADEATALRGAREWDSRNPNRRSAWNRVDGAVNALGQGLTDTLVDATEMTAAPLVNRVARIPGARPVVQNFLRTIDERPRYTPQGDFERGLFNLGRFVPNAVAPGSAGARAAAVVGPVIGGEVGERAGGSGGRAVGELAGGVASAIRRTPQGGQRPTRAQQGAARVVGGGPQQAQAMRERQAGFEAAGIRPTPADVTSIQGRRNVRAVAGRSEGGQEATRALNDRRSASLGGRVGGQARRIISDDPRTPDQIRTEQAAHRTAQADAQYDAVRNDPVTLDDHASEVLTTDYGMAAIRQAVAREPNPALRQEIEALINAPPGHRTTIGAVDRVSRVLLSQAQGNRGADPDLARTQTIFGTGVRQPALDASPGYGQAVDDFAADSRLIEAAGTGENFLVRDTDAFAAAVGGMSDDEAALARAAARRAVERAAGEGGNAPSVARSISRTDEQHQRNVALLGNDDAARFEQGVAAELRLAQNAADIDPRTGSQTQMNLMNDSNVAAGGAVVGRALQGNWGGSLGAAWSWLRSRGINERDAEQYVAALLDPDQTNAVIAALERRSPGMGHEMVRVLTNPTLALTASASLGSPQ